MRTFFAAHILLLNEAPKRQGESSSVLLIAFNVGGDLEVLLMNIDD